MAQSTKSKMYCKYLGCKNNHFDVDLSFFRFPPQEERCKIWVERSKNPKLLNYTAGRLYALARLCSDHFDLDQFLNSTKRGLIKTAIPKIGPYPVDCEPEIRVPSENEIRASRHRCKAVGCNSSSLDEDVHFHRFPSELNRRLEWVRRLGNPELLALNPSSGKFGSINVCSKHFPRSQYMNDGMTRLVWNAVPSIFDYEPAVDPALDLLCQAKPRVLTGFNKLVAEGDDNSTGSKECSRPKPNAPMLSMPPQPENEDKSFIAHIDVLSLASPKLSAMLNDGRVAPEGKCYRVLNLDIEEEVCYELLRYIYLGKIGKVSDKLRLLEAAKKYEVMSLFEVLQKCIPVDTSNAAELLLRADHLDASLLKAKAIECINKQPAVVMATEGWKTLAATRPHLVVALYSQQVTAMQSNTPRYPA